MTKRNRPTVAAQNALVAALEAANARIAELAAAVAPVQAEEVEIVFADAPDALFIGGRDTHYASATLGRASSTIGARGLNVVRPAPKAGGLAHRRAAAALQALGAVTGDSISGRDAEAIARCYQDANGFAMMVSSVGPALAKWADAGWLVREGAGAGTRGNGYTVADAMWEGLTP